MIQLNQDQTLIKLEQLEKELTIVRCNRNSRSGLKIFALSGSKNFGQTIASHLNMELCPHIECNHPDGELYVRPAVNVRRSNVFVICSLYGDNEDTINDKIAKVQYMVGALKDASADEIIVVAPYLGYSRSDRKVKSRDPVITKYLARTLEVVGTNRVITMDVHSLQAYQNAFSECRADHLTCVAEFAEAVSRQLPNVESNAVGVLSPDSGGFARCEAFRQSLQRRMGNGIGMAWVDKRHTNMHEKESYTIIGDIRPLMIVFDDMIASAKTISLAAKVAIEQGVHQVWCAATHCLGVGEANNNLNEKNISKIFISDTIEPFRLSVETLKKTEIVATTHLWAEAIRRTYTGESLSSMFLK